MDTIAPWIILFAPLVSAVLILLFGRLSRKLSAGLAIASALIGAALSWYLFLLPGEIEAGKIVWLDFSPGLQVNIGLTLDALSKLMLVVVNTIASLVFIYSLGYMAREEGYWRYFAGLSLFLFSMLGIVLADNLIMMFIFWELVGVSSYILIGHYYSRASAAEACKQAFIVNRIGDFGFMLGILVLWLQTGTVEFAELEQRIGAFAEIPQLLALALVLVFCGTIGKSAQMPLHVWLPNSMEGPTPVSSLLHAATMVAAGVYLLARIFSILELSAVALHVIAWVGAITCFLAGLMGTQQNDIKRILAYSTISQLGYMVLAVGIASTEEVPMFHLFTHAFFKCLLFLCAGSVILGMHHEQDIWKMGGLRTKMPVTLVACAAGCLALMGFPGFSGHFSKDLIIELTAAKSAPLFWIAVGGVALTAFYTARLFLVVFLGSPRSDAARHAHESPKVMTIPLILLGLAAIFSGWPFVSHFFFHELPHPEVGFGVKAAINVALFLGLLLALGLYARGPAKDPVSIPFFANRLYLDDLYAQIVRLIQDGGATVMALLDRWVIDLAVRLLAVGARGAGFVLALFQTGNLQAYSFFFGAGVIVIIYLLLFK